MYVHVQLQARTRGTRGKGVFAPTPAALGMVLVRRSAVLLRPLRLNDKVLRRLLLDVTSGWMTGTSSARRAYVTNMALHASAVGSVMDSSALCDWSKCRSASLMH